MRPLALVLLVLLGGSVRAQSPAPAEQKQVVLVIHGGAGVMTLEEMAAVTLENGEKLTREHYEAALAAALAAGHEAYQAGGPAPQIDAVEAAIRVMEDSELFNAGRGAALDHDGRASLDAAFMDGRMSDPGADAGEGKKDPRKRAGAVTAVTHVKNPISAARAVMEMPDRNAVLLVGEGAENFVLSEENRKRYGLERVSNVYFWTGRRLGGVRKVIETEAEERRAKQGTRLKGARPRPSRDLVSGTVGAVAVKEGRVAAGTSTGGLTGKMLGRVGDSPLIGSGTYADDRACGISCTGTGEVFIRHGVAHDVVARMLYGKVPVTDAATLAIDQLPDEEGGVGGLIALDRDGSPAFAMSKRSVGMYRGYVTASGEVHVALFRDEPFKKMVRTEAGWKPGG